MRNVILVLTDTRDLKDKQELIETIKQTNKEDCVFKGYIHTKKPLLHDAIYMIDSAVRTFLNICTHIFKTAKGTVIDHLPGM